MNPGWRRNYLRYKTYFLNVIGKYRDRAEVKAYLEILLSLLTISIFGIFALRPTLVTIAGLIREIETKRETLAKMDDKIQKLSQAQSLYDRERSRIALLNTAIPNRPTPEIFARQIEGLSVKNSVSIFGIETGSATILGEDTSVNQSTASEGLSLPQNAGQVNYIVRLRSPIEGYQSLHSFLTDAENLRTLNKFISVDMSTVTDNEGRFLILLIDGLLPYYK